MAYGKDIGAKAPPPEKLKGYKGGGNGDEAGGEAEGDEDEAKAARVSVMQEVIDAFKNNDAEAACEALERYNDLS